MKKKLLLFSTLFMSFWLQAQEDYHGNCCPEPPAYVAGKTAQEIYKDIEKLSFLGSVLYLAAHPDDENTRLIAYLSNEVKAITAYLSLTRGDGGQNRIGSELRELLGVIRTQELLAARAIDGGKQYFSRANDFGYSKVPEETLRFWDREKVLADMVWVIRRFRPDIIINRFDHRTPGSTHGHHTASAMLSLEAFSLASDNSAFAEQLQYTAPHQADRLLLNISPWFYKDQAAFESADKSEFITLDVNAYYPAKGKSNAEMAAEARSQHRCQAMGTSPKRGKQMEYLEHIAGNKPKDKNNIFSGINTTWSRVKDGAPIADMIEKILADYHFEAPYKSLPALVQLYHEMDALQDCHWKRVKMEALKKILLQVANIHLVALSKEDTYVAGEVLDLTLEVLRRSSGGKFSAKLIGYTIFENFHKCETDFPYGNFQRIENKITIPKTLGYDNPYWLQGEATLGMYEVSDILLRGKPEAMPKLSVDVRLDFDGLVLDYKLPVVYKFTDAVVGELYKQTVLTPPVFVQLDSPVYLFPKGESKKITITLRAGKDNVQGTLYAGAAAGWRANPAFVNFDLAKKGASKTFAFELSPPTQTSTDEILPYVVLGKDTCHLSRHDIAYRHIPHRIVFLQASAKTVRMDLKTGDKRIAYLPGAGDKVAEQLQQIGYTVDIISIGDLVMEKLQNYDVLIFGIRAYNILEGIAFRQNVIFDFVKSGGTFIVQYNTNHRLKVEQILPYPIHLSRDRVTDEEAIVHFLLPEHRLLNFPNKISPRDFDHWVQERGLYFPDKWDSRYDAILTCHDADEDAKVSGLLYAPYGKGCIIYTGYSFFRQLPAGVPGAFRLFVNLVECGGGV